jgi:amino acid transporter
MRSTPSDAPSPPASSAADAASPATKLRRVVTLPVLILYAVGVSVGAGIFVLVGRISGLSGTLAPMAFLLAGIIVAFTAFTFAEFASRLPRAAGEAAYVNAAFNSRALTCIIGLAVAAAATISAAAIVNGSRAYVQQLVTAPEWQVELAIIALMTGIAIWGVTQSMVAMGLVTVVETGTLIWVVIVALTSDGVPNAPAALPPAEPAVTGLLAALLLAVFAFIGFESTVNMAEEVRQPRRTIPLALLITLVVVGALYAAVSAAALVVATPMELAAADAPLAMVYQHATGKEGTFLNGLAVCATVNGVLAQIVMVSRLLFGMAEDGFLPAPLAYVWPRTRTPVVTTVIAGAVVLLLALAVPIEPLARLTSSLILVIFAIVNAALVWIKLRRVPPPRGAFTVPIGVPAAGVIFSLLPVGWEAWRLL